MSEHLATHAPVNAKSIIKPIAGRVLQRACACGNHSGSGGECEACKKKREGTLQRAAINSSSVHDVPPIVHEVLRSSGQPLDAATRSFMEPRFGHDFSGVRVHTDAKAAESAHAVNALAYTVGHDVAFGPGQYTPETHAGRRLLAHELTHVVQQSRSAKPDDARLALGPEADEAEGEAAQAAAKVISSTSTSRAPVAKPTPISARRLQRQFITPLAAGGGYRGLMERDRRAAMQSVSSGGESATEDSTGPVIYMCSKALETSPLGSHAFFRIGGAGKGNPTISLEPIDTSLGADCWQGIPDRDYPSDFNVDAECEATAISLACLEREFRAYPIGHYCTLGPNSNTFVGHVARQCGLSNPDPAGWTPGIDDSPPPSGTFAPDKWETLTGCETKICVIDPERPPEPIG